MPDRPDAAWRRVLFTPTAGRLRAGWRLAAVVPALLAAMLLASFLLVAVLAIAPPSGPIAAVAFAVAWLALYGALAVTVLAMARWIDRRPWNAWLDGPAWWPDVAAGFAIGLAMATAAVGAGLAGGVYRFAGALVTRPDAPLLAVSELGVETGRAHPLLVVALLLVIYVGVGVFEELLIRGYLLTNLAEGVAGVGRVDARGAIVFAAIATSVLFSLLHLANPGAGPLGTLNVALAGVFFAGTYVATGSLGIPIGIHVAWNFALGGLYDLPVSGLESGGSLLDVETIGGTTVTGGGFGPEAGIVFYPALVVGVLASVAWIRYTRGAFAVRESIATYAPSPTRPEDAP
jgi:membrane protease YdiL (CAAX protease family)